MSLRSTAQCGLVEGGNGMDLPLEEEFEHKDVGEEKSSSPASASSPEAPREESRRPSASTSPSSLSRQSPLGVAAPPPPPPAADRKDHHDARLLLQRCQEDAARLLARRRRAAGRLGGAAFQGPSAGLGPQGGQSLGVSAHEGEDEPPHRPIHSVEDTVERPLPLQYHYYVTTSDQQDDTICWSSLKDSFGDDFGIEEEEEALQEGGLAWREAAADRSCPPRHCRRSASAAAGAESAGGKLPSGSSGSSAGRGDAGSRGRSRGSASDDVEAAAAEANAGQGTGRGSRGRRISGAGAPASANLTSEKIGDARTDDGGGDDEDSVGGTVTGAPDSDYPTYRVKVNPDQQDRAVDIPLYSFARPHMRAFHLSWMSFLVAFFVWFSISPLLSEVASALDLSREEVWTSSCLAVASSAVTRVLVGPFNDKYGARWVMAVSLVAAAVPTGLAGLLVHGSASLSLVRFFIGTAGSAFVTSQYWTSSVFCVEIAGTANALAAGWGNLGGSLAQVVMGSILFPLFKLIYGGTGYTYNADLTSFDDSNNYPSQNTSAVNSTHSNDQEGINARASDLAWRTVMVFPALMAVAMAWVVIRYGDDTPKGNVWKRRSERPAVSWSENLWLGMRNRNTWVLFAQYASCFGCEITLFNAAALYFKEEYGQSTESAAAIASAFGWTNLFARGLGGFCSDMANARSGMRGRLWTQSIFLVMEGVLTMAFAATHTLAGSIVTMVVFSVFLQAAKGTTFGIVPYVLPEQTGSVAGWVGAGGNFGGVLFSLLFRSFDYHTSFLAMGAIVLASSLLTVFICIPGHRGLFFGHDSPVVYEHRRLAKLPEAITFTRPDVAACPATPEGSPSSVAAVPAPSAAASSLVLSSGGSEGALPAIDAKPPHLE